MHLSDAKSQNDTLEIKEAISQLFEGMSAFDSSLVKSVFAPDATLQTIVKNDHQNTVVKRENLSSFLKAIGTKLDGVIFDERIISYDIKVDGDMAMVWTPYHFYMGDVFSHCGVNLFTMVKTASKWKILNITDTRRKNDCP